MWFLKDKYIAGFCMLCFTIVFAFAALYIIYDYAKAPQPTIETHYVKPAVQTVTESTKDFTNVVDDLYTLCVNSDQFGLTYKHIVEVGDNESIIAQQQYHYSNKEKEGNVIITKPNYKLKVWFNNNNETKIADISVGNISSGYTVFDEQTANTPLGIFMKSSVDIDETLNLLKNVTDTDVTTEDMLNNACVSETAQYYTSGKVKDSVVPYLFLSDAASCWSYSTLYITSITETKYIVQLEVHYTDNVLGVKSETLHFEVLEDVDGTWRMPEDINDNIQSIDVFERLYDYATR